MYRPRNLWDLDPKTQDIIINAMCSGKEIDVLVGDEVWHAGYITNEPATFW